MKEAVLQALDEAERKAIDNLARYKFQGNYIHDSR